MHTFFEVTSLLFSSIKEALNKFFNFSSTFLITISLLLCIVFVINICKKGVTKKFFQNNKIFINVIIALLLVACLLSSDINTLKGSVLIISICLFVTINKSVSKKKVIKEIDRNKTIKRERKKKNETV